MSLPLARVKRIMRMDDEVKQVSAEAARLVGLATVCPAAADSPHTGSARALRKNSWRGSPRAHTT